MIDKSGKWWTGTEFEDLVTYLREFTAESYPAGPIVQSTCECGNQVFALEFDDDEGCARRTCTSCGRSAFIADSADYWDEAEPGKAQCPWDKKPSNSVLPSRFATTGRFAGSPSAHAAPHAGCSGPTSIGRSTTARPTIS